MSDAEYDIFGSLNAFCKDKKQQKYNETPSQPNSDSDDDLGLDVLREDTLLSPNPNTQQNKFTFKSSLPSPPTCISPVSRILATTSKFKIAAKSKAKTVKSTKVTNISSSSCNNSMGSTTTKSTAKYKTRKSCQNSDTSSPLSSSSSNISWDSDASKSTPKSKVKKSTTAPAAPTAKSKVKNSNAVPAAPTAKSKVKKSTVASAAPTTDIPTSATMSAVMAVAVKAAMQAANLENSSGTRAKTRSSRRIQSPTSDLALPPPTLPKRGRKKTPAAAASSISRRVRNTQISEVAACAPIVDFVDLISSPISPINKTVPPTKRGRPKKQAGTANVIIVDDDNDSTTQPMQTTVDSLDLSFEADNPELSVKINWKGIPEIFKLRKYQKFTNIFEELAARENTDVANVVLNLNSKFITTQDTPASIDYKIYNFIDGRVLMQKLDLQQKKRRDPNKVALKIQSDQWKRPLLVDILKSDKFKILYIKCAEELNIPYTNLKLIFDGELLEYNGTPADLEFEGGEAIDLRIKK